MTAVILRTTCAASCHADGSVSYFDPLRQEWRHNQPTIPPHALAILTADEEARVRRHLARHGVFV